MSIVAAAARIRELLHWTPEFDDLDTIVRPCARLGAPSDGAAPKPVARTAASA